ncbi:hypothetical protein [Spiroplasma endosymbiont of Aspidapion aeneum]|uniref:hypothetical protein n=1 Tax=Spiroplasma endosymbiont of Aspidapion aeneum TaxID=3066276 RepID=UPI00313AAE80
MKKKNSYLQLLTNMFDKHKNKSKFKKITLILLTGLTISSSIATGCVLATKHNNIQQPEQFYYKYDNTNFKDKDDLLKYALSKSKQKEYDYQSSQYLFQGQYYQSQDQLNKGLADKFKIDEVSTIKNPINYITESSGKLSNLVITDKNDSNVKVYQGSNGSAYLDKNDALETYKNNYNITYKACDKEFENIYSAQQYYKDVKLKELENNNESAQTCYMQGALAETKDEIKNWIRKNIKKGFDVNGNQFSDYNYSEFLNQYKNIDNGITDKYIKKADDAKLNTYWIDQINTNVMGYFSGPKYVETPQNLNESLNFEESSSFDINALLIPKYLEAVGGCVIYNVLTQSEQSNENYDFLKYWGEVKETIKSSVDDSVISQIDNYISKLGKDIINKANEQLACIQDPKLNNFYKFLISMKRILERMKMFPNHSIKPAELEKLFKQIIIGVIDSKKEFSNKFFKPSNNTNILLDDSVSFKDLYNLFLNTNQFYNDSSSNPLSKLNNFVKNAQGVLNNIFDLIGNGASMCSGLNEYTKGPKQDNKDVSGKIRENQQICKNTLSNQSDKLFDALGFKNNELKTNLSIGAPSVLGIISEAWSLGNSLSFLSVKTYEAKIDENQSIYYTVPVLKIPVINFDITKPDIKTHVYELTTAPVQYSPEGKNADVYQFNDCYYFNKEQAINDLRIDMYQNPEKYFITKKIFVSNLDNSEFIINLDKIKTDYDSNGITSAKYQKAFNEAKENFVDKLFNKYYENTKKTFYLDGFGNYFEEKESAIASLNKNVDKLDNYKKFYTYKTENDKKFYFEKKQDVENFIVNNQLIKNKNVLSSQLYTTMIYGQLTRLDDQSYTIYRLDYYGKYLYFTSRLQAFNYLKNHVDYKVVNTDNQLFEYNINDKKFYNKNDFDRYILNLAEKIYKQWCDNKGDKKYA